MAAPADPLAALLDDARVQGRPSVSISPGLAAELLGFAPDIAYWASRELDGWIVEVGGVITFSPVAEQTDLEVTDVRLIIEWRRPAEAITGAGIFRVAAAGTVRFGEVADVKTVEGADVLVATGVSISLGQDVAPASLDDPRLRRLALLAAEIEQDAGGGSVGGGSGI